MDNNQQTYQRSAFDEYYEFFPSLEDETVARKTFSRLSLSIFLFITISYVATYLISIGASLILMNTNPGLVNVLINDPVFSTVLSYGCMYLLAFPVMLLIIKNMKTVKIEKSKISFGGFIALICVSQAISYVGNIIGQTLNGIIGIFLNREVTNSIDQMANETPLWLFAIIALIIAPIFEELIFRKLLIDRLSGYGDIVAIAFSSIAFGLFHGNFYQFFYTIGFGLVLSYLYCKTRKIHLTMLLHSIMNFIGGIVVYIVNDYYDDFVTLNEKLLDGATLDSAEELELLISSLVVNGYSTFYYGLLAAGALILVFCITKKMIVFNNRGTVRLDVAQATRFSLLNVGSVLFLLCSAIIFALSIFLI